MSADCRMGHISQRYEEGFSRGEFNARPKSGRAVSFTERAAQIGPLATPPRGVGALGFGRRAEAPDQNDPIRGQTRPNSRALTLSVYRFVQSGA